MWTSPCLLVLANLISFTNIFGLIPSLQSPPRAIIPIPATRRDVLSNIVISSAAIATMTSSPSFCGADVSDGNSLPQGAAQFSRVIKTRAQLKSVAERVSEKSTEIDKKEWDNIDAFLRTVYSAGEDMKIIAKSSIFDPEKRTKAEEAIKLLQKLAQAAQGPVSKRDAEGFSFVAAKVDRVFEDFLDLLTDVPDEI